MLFLFMNYGVVGSRDFIDYELLKNTLNALSDIALIVSGGATGADQLARRYATEHNIPIREHLPDWQKYGRSAGPRRNRLIVQDSDVIIAFWDGKSRGTKSTIDIARQNATEVRVVRTDR